METPEAKMLADILVGADVNALANSPPPITRSIGGAEWACTSTIMRIRRSGFRRNVRHCVIQWERSFTNLAAGRIRPESTGL
ncbi:hypothetical protein XFF6166_10222 [Xanthomonas citri pv. fuscans]|uniref:hypothetical protein n=1 Tax=Xanthomonas citri TaxID=346 RepID=UPI0004539336|nr:hypothetical protein [Xanthomonas citri]EWC50582.1 hypothetical protein XAR_3011 [Xanthomonas citri pv. glycines str. 8ra]SON74837.1 hypothetical protein XFF6166_10222 [Xanthomonas citri pv. fuscans]WAW91929.1 hypothetical protein LPY95_03970 [Xanthomonas citri pv. malvacearum]SOO02170.1 hypothetical protein XFF6960_580087 [Xanthomonas citri pv. fuscans]SOO06814.1 hypothetical protein XFF7767_80224 [Xanthomonas citri pv. fuscans]